MNQQQVSSGTHYGISDGNSSVKNNIFY